MIVEVKQGKVEGIVETSILTGKSYYSFLGIPYAKPPVGDLRFRPPVPLEKWNGILEAKNEGPQCPQYSVLTKRISGNEDCLYLNVYVPEPPTEIKIPKAVLVYIHGGGYFQGSGARTLNSGDYLMNYDVIFVTLNYRLQALGFLNLDTVDCPGNCGLKDQTLALRWIKENIRAFGGDSENITIAGCSAGAFSVHWHLLSPLSKGLFQKAILQSGVRLCGWSYTSNPMEMALKLGGYLGFRGNDAEALLRFLKDTPADDIIAACHQMMEDMKQEFPGINSGIVFAPSQETVREGAFLPDKPQNLVELADPVPIIAGLCEKEGKLFVRMNSEDLLRIFREDIEPLVKINYKCDSQHLPGLVNEVKRFYCGDDARPKVTDECIIDLFTDLLFMNFYKSIDHITRSKFPVYVYQFSFDGKLNFSNLERFDQLVPRQAELRNIAGVSHGDELAYLYYPKMLNITTAQIDEPEITVIANMCTLWTNFAKNGNPNDGTKNVEWKPHTTNEPCYLNIGEDLKLIRGRIFEERIAFWEKMQDKFRQFAEHL